MLLLFEDYDVMIIVKENAAGRIGIHVSGLFADSPLSTALLVFLLASMLAPVRFTDAKDAAESRRAEMIRRIDTLLFERWKEEGVAAPLSSDAEFLRRVYLDLTGVIPRVANVRAFLAGDRAEKRALLIDQLLESPAHSTHMAITWRNIMLPNGFEPEQIRNAAGLQRWFQDQFVENLRYDRLVSEFLVAKGNGQTGPALFYTSLELKPEKLASRTSRIFLGIQIDCAECHDHPHDRWTQKDFWGYAAFFARLRQPSDEQPLNDFRVEDLSEGEVKVPDTQQVVSPIYPGNEPARSDARGTRRVQLSIWMASRDNPYLARAAVNRAWAQMFGRGIVDPIDDFGPNNPPSHPELLDELSQYFVQTGFDLRELYRTLANTRAYQLSSHASDDSPSAPQLFNRMAIKTLTPEQLYDSLSRALISRPPAQVPGTQAVSRLFDPGRQAFVAKMQSPNSSPTRFDAGVPQALTLMNGSEIHESTVFEQSRLLGSVEAPFLSDEERINILFLSTLTRFPSDGEKSKFISYVSRAAETNEQNRALSDILWALLNCAEFAFNH